MQYTIDAGLPGSAVVAVCECRQRFLAVSEPAVMARLAEHAKTWHPGDTTLSETLAKRRTRKRRAAGFVTQPT